MAIAVGNSAVVKVIDNALSEQEHTIFNTGSNAAFVSRDPAVAASGGHVGHSLAAAASMDVSLKIGEALYAICASAQTTTLDVD